MVTDSPAFLLAAPGSGSGLSGGGSAGLAIVVVVVVGMVATLVRRRK